MRRKWKFIVPVLALLSTCLLFRFVLFIGYVPTESMEPTLKKGSIIVGSRIFGKLNAGEIVVFEHDGKIMLKRIAAVSGDTIEHRGNLQTVPTGSIYVLGDNTANSFDSRFWDEPFVSCEKVIAVFLCSTKRSGMSVFLVK